MFCLIPVLYQARIHPEQYSNTLPTDALKTLHETIHTVTTTAANVLGDSSKFPADWLFSYRWGKGSSYRGKKGGKAESNVLPNGEKIIHITVGGRTSAVVESRQKKIKSSDEPAEDENKKPTPKKGKKVKDEDLENGQDKISKGTKKKDAEDIIGKRKAKMEVKEEETTPKKRRVSGKQATNGGAKDVPMRKSSRSRAS
jgi:formamidopyrimidine-DNA glycosylase